MTQPAAEDFAPGRPVFFRNATVLTVDSAGVLEGADVLVRGQTIAEVGQGLTKPDDAVEIDASGGILMPGMIDTHRHMWQTALRGFGADWTLTNYFFFYYLNWGKIFRPQDIYAGNLLSAIESIDAGVTTTVDWSHGLQTVDHGEAAVDALEEVPGRFVLAYGNLLGAPWEWSKSPEFRDFVSRRMDGKGDMLGFQLAFDVTGDPAFPEQGAFESARELGVGVTTHVGVWGATDDTGIKQISDGGFMDEKLTCVHAATLSEDSYHRIAASGARSRSRPRASRAPVRATPRPGSSGSTESRCRCRWTPACGGAPTCSRPCGPPSRPTAVASTWRPTPRVRRCPATPCVRPTWSR
jgi:5-methylthioadenosine/S-adenosylhomocysteine deaminase